MDFFPFNGPMCNLEKLLEKLTPRAVGKCFSPVLFFLKISQWQHQYQNAKGGGGKGKF